MQINKEWKITKRVSNETSSGLGQFPPLVAQLLYNRGVKTAEQATEFLLPTKDSLHAPTKLPDMDEAINRLKMSIDSSETVAIFGDFDADGVTATAVLALGFLKLGLNIIPYIPDRIYEGHGLNTNAIDYLKDNGASLIVTVDCGTTAVNEIAYAKTLGIDTIVTDHHVPQEELPDTKATINPQLEGHSYPFLGLSGVGLAFKLIQGLYENLGIEWDPALLQLVAIGTVTDVAPLLDENRYLVSAGLNSMVHSPLPGIKKLMQMSRIDKKDKLGTGDISFSIGPLVNAPGRLDHAMKSYQMLISSNELEADELANDINTINKTRQNLTQQAVAIARSKVSEDEPLSNITLIWDEEFKPGIVGLVASRLVDEYSKPAVVIAVEGNLARGSARSTPNFNMVEALSSCSDLFTKFGGHPMAGGFTIRTQDLHLLKTRMQEINPNTLPANPSQQTLNVDANVRISTLTGDTFNMIRLMEPYGESNAEPLFLTTGVQVLSVSFMGKNKQHIRMRILHQGSVWEAVGFNQSNNWVDSYKTLDIVYSVGLDTWSGREIFKLYLKDFRNPNPM